MSEALARFTDLFDPASAFRPFGDCIAWSRAVLWPLVAGDALMALACLSIPAALLVFMRQRGDMRFNPMLRMLCAFTVLTSAAHLLAALSIWHPVYALQGAVTLANGLAAVVTAVLLWPLIPKALRIPSINQLQAAIARLETEAVERRKAEARLARMNTELEARILERTQDLEREVAERQRLQDADRARQAAELASSAKSEFLSRMSHELRTPLNAVLGFAQLSARSLADNDIVRTRTFLQHIEDGGWHLVKMIDDILDISRIEQGRQTFTIGAVDLAPAVAEAAATVQAQAAKSGVTLSVDLPQTPPTALADRTRLIQVFTNLIGNAAKFNRPGGRVDVRVRPAEAGQVRIDVADTGLGMSPTQLGQLFQPFNRLGRERLGIPGTGIGLVLVRHLVEQMGGNLEVTSDEGSGSVFSVVLKSEA